MKVLFIVHQIIAFIACGLIFAIQDKIAVTPMLVLFYIMIGVALLIPFIVSRGIWNKIYRHQDMYFFISTLPILLVALISIFQHWDIYGPIIKGFFD